MIVVRIDVLTAHIILATSVVTNVVKVGVYVIQRRTGGCAALRTGRGHTAGRTAVGVCRYVNVAAHVTGMVAVARCIGAALNNGAAHVTRVIGIRVRIGMLAHACRASITLVILVSVRVRQCISARKGGGIVRANRTAGTGFVINRRTRAGGRRLECLSLYRLDGIGVRESLALGRSTGLTGFWSRAGRIGPIVSQRI